MEFNFNDGGRAEAKYIGDTGDCGVRATAIATGMDYKKVYNDLFELTGNSPRNGIHRKDLQKYLSKFGWEWIPTMQIGSGCTVHMLENELPKGTIIARVSKHYSCVIDGVINDTFNPSRDGTRCVYGYWRKETK